MFWDASALMPLLVKEKMTQRMRELGSEGAHIVWWASRVECTSALSRVAREGRLTTSQFEEALGRLNDLFQHCVEVQPTERVRERALRLLRVHSLRAADALQLGAALTVCEEQPARTQFACLDERLRTAARNEGFSIVP